MTHLTTKQILQFVDGSLDYAGQAQCTSHLALCDRCRREVELQKRIAKASRSQAIVRTSSRFVHNVMANVLPQPAKTWKVRLLDNLGNLLAMATVLAVLGYAIANPSLFNGPPQTTRQTLIPQNVSDAYQSFMQTLSLRANAALQQVSARTGTNSNEVIILTSISLIILIVLDQFVLKRYMGLRMRR